MNDTKRWYQSRGAVANVVGSAVSLAALAGIAVSPEARELIEVAILAAGTLVTSVFGLYGRLKATRRIGKGG